MARFAADIAGIKRGAGADGIRVPALRDIVAAFAAFAALLGQRAGGGDVVVPGPAVRALRVWAGLGRVAFVSTAETSDQRGWVRDIEVASLEVLLRSGEIAQPRFIQSFIFWRWRRGRYCSFSIS